MRKTIAALSAAGLLVLAMLSGSASARTESHFTVIGVTKSSHPSGESGVIVRDKLVVPGDRDHVIGHARIKFTPVKTDSVRARGVFSLGGGTLKVKGTFGVTGSTGRINVIGGTRRWNGAAG